jgi:predicted oxidoreductase
MAASDRREDRFGFDDEGTVVTRALARLVPQSVARRALAVDVSVDRPTYAVGDDVRFRVTFRNRLPLPVVVETPDRRLWGWTVDGELEASDESRFADPTRDTPGQFAFRGRERRTVSRTWRGRFRRVREDAPTRWVDADPGRHELGVFLAYDGGDRATTTFEVVPASSADAPD